MLLAPFGRGSFSRSFQPGFPGKQVSCDPRLLWQELCEASTKCRREEKPETCRVSLCFAELAALGRFVPHAGAAPRVPGEGTCGVSQERSGWLELLQREEGLGRRMRLEEPNLC